VITTEADTLNAMEGYVQTVAPGATACLACLNRIDRERARIERLPEDEREQELERGYIAESDLAPEPAVVHLNTTIAGMAVSEVVNLVTGVDTPAGLIRYEALDHSFVSMGTTAARSEGCPVCGHNVVLAQGTANHTVVEIDEEKLDLSFDETGTDEAMADDTESTDSNRIADVSGYSPGTSETADDEPRQSEERTNNQPPMCEDGDESLSLQPGVKSEPEAVGESKSESEETESEAKSESDESEREKTAYLPLPYYLSTDSKGVFPWNH